jgi:hypothetical protein
MVGRNIGILLGSAAIVSAGAIVPASASSHREAPGITMTPKLDATDLYMFRSYETGRSSFVTMIANYQPFEDPRGGPNYFQMDPDAFYDIDVDNVGDGEAHLIFRFTFQNKVADLSVKVGRETNAIPLINDGPIHGTDLSTSNVIESYHVSMIRLKNGIPVSTTPLTSKSGGTTFRKPTDNIGNKSIPDYSAYAAQFIYDVKISGCPTPGRIFAGQRKDPFYVNLGDTFDLINIKNPIGESNANSAPDALAGDNVTALELEVPAECLKAGKPVIGVWTTSSKILGKGSVQQTSRLGNPLVNELVIGLPDKDKWNASQPSGDAQFLKYVTNPTLPALIATLYPNLKAPTQFPRQDLVAVFLTGISGLNQPAGGKPAEEMRLNLDIKPTPAANQNPLGVIGGDNAGYPNGRRPADDVVDISLRVVMGKLYSLGFFGGKKFAPSGDVELTDGVRKTAKKFDDRFPYLLTPIPGAPESAYNAAVAADR